MRDRGLPRLHLHDSRPVGAHSVGDRGVGRPRSGLLHGDRGVGAHGVGLYVPGVPFLTQREGAGVKGPNGHRLVRDRL